MTSSSCLDGTEEVLRPPPKLALSEWADRHFRLSAESAAAPGRWHTLPYQRGILDAITDPLVTRVSVMKSARIGYTKCINAAIAYYLCQDPCPVMVVQPTVEDAEGYSKEEIAPMVRDVEPLAALAPATAAKTSDQTILDKKFRGGGSVSMVGANSGRGFRRVSRRVVIFDEVDGYPASAGGEGDPIKLGERRAEYYWNRKIVAGSTPLVAGSSRIEEMFEAGDQRHYHVPCPHCEHRDYLVFDEKSDRGHVMWWPPDQPELAGFKCRACGCLIEESHKREMLERGEWIAESDFDGHASFHIWAAYSLSPNASWGQIATEFIEVKDDPLKLRTFVNTALGQTWQERGDAPDWERLYQRREKYATGSVPSGVVVLTCGVDVQQDRFVYEVVGWAPNKESWSITAGEIHGDTALEATWLKLDDELLALTFAGADGQLFQIAKLAVDSGFRTQMAYNWARRHPMSRVIATKGVSGSRAMVGLPTPVDVTTNGKRMQRGYKVWPIGIDIAKSELYGFLRLPHSEGDPPAGYCHFPEHDPEFFKQLTAEHLVSSSNKRTGRVRREWQVQPNRQNHFLDARILARVCAALLGIDRMAPPPRAAAAPAPARTQPAPPAHESMPVAAERPPWRGRGSGYGGDDWF